MGASSLTNFLRVQAETGNSIYVSSMLAPKNFSSQQQKKAFHQKKKKKKKSTCKFLVLISYPNKTVELSKMKNNAFVGQHHYHIALKHIRKMSKVNKRISISFAKL